VRFYLDHNVDARCARRLTKLGHEAWTTSQAGRPDATDDEQTIYANEHRAVLVTHDREFTERRKRQPYGWHIRLVVEEPDGPDLLVERLDEALDIIQSNDNVTIELRPDGVHPSFGTKPSKRRSPKPRSR
jgi:predicted nuclease of predicted toxin-antitoxin system